MKDELRIAKELALEAGRVVLEVYATEFAVHDKGGEAGPVTEADRRANALIVEGLRKAFPNDGVIAEESKVNSDAARHARCWYVDPLDGTKEFVARNGEFAVQIGLAVGGEARVGVVYQPVGGRVFAGAEGVGCTLDEGGQTRALVMPKPGKDLRIVVSRSHRSKRTELICELLGIEQVIPCGSVGVKCSRLAEGVADLYVHGSGKSSRWDACGPEAVLRAAGGSFTDLFGDRYRYDGAELENARGLLGCHPDLLERVLPAIRRVYDDR